jgi:glycosyltransferase involved in cell wall biosynthesis
MTVRSRATVSVVIPNRNRTHELFRAVDGALGATGDLGEVIVVDDASDNAAEIHDELVRRFGSRVRWIGLPELSGGAFARNAGVQAAKSEWIAFLDSDDEFLSHKFEVLTPWLADGRARAFYHQVEVVIDGRRQRVAPRSGISSGERVTTYLFVRGGAMMTPSLVVSRELMLSCPFHVGLKRHQDLQLVLDLAAAGHVPVFIPAVLARVYWSLSSRPVGKGESPYFSLAWARANRGMFDLKSYSKFVRRFVVRKLLESGRRRSALAVLMSDGGRLSLLMCLEFVALAISPPLVRAAAYRVYKVFQR